jgi:hypothetical protein
VIIDPTLFPNYPYPTPPVRTAYQTTGQAPAPAPAPAAEIPTGVWVAGAAVALIAVIALVKSV